METGAGRERGAEAHQPDGGRSTNSRRPPPASPFSACLPEQHDTSPIAATHTTRTEERGTLNGSQPQHRNRNPANAVLQSPTLEPVQSPSAADSGGKRERVAPKKAQIETHSMQDSTRVELHTAQHTGRAAHRTAIQQRCLESQASIPQLQAAEQESKSGQHGKAQRRRIQPRVASEPTTAAH